MNDACSRLLSARILSGRTPLPWFRHQKQEQYPGMQAKRTRPSAKLSQTWRHNHRNAAGVTTFEAAWGARMEEHARARPIMSIVSALQGTQAKRKISDFVVVAVSFLEMSGTICFC